MEELCEVLLKDFLIKDDHVGVGYLYDDLESFMGCLKAEGFEYSIRSSVDPCKREAIVDHNYDQRAKKLNVKFLEVEGTPFYFGKFLRMQCVHGGKYRRSNPKPELEGHPKKRRRHRQTKKLGCPSSIEVREQLVFTEPKYAKAGLGSERNKRKVVEEIRKTKSEEFPPTRRRYKLNIKFQHNHDITVSNLENHSNSRDQLEGCYEESEPSDSFLDVEGSIVDPTDSVERLQRSIREYLKECSNLSHDCVDLDCLRAARGLMDQVCKLLKEGVRQENDLSPFSKWKNSDKPNYSQKRPKKRKRVVPMGTGARKRQELSTNLGLVVTMSGSD